MVAIHQIGKEVTVKMKALKLVIVGGVAAGASAAAKARRCNENAEIIMFEKGPDISYATCGLPYYLSGVIQERKRLLVTTASFFRRRFAVDVRTNQEVIHIDPIGHKVVVKDFTAGKEYEETYDKLVLAPGASPVIPPIPGAYSPMVHTVKTLEDTDRIFSYMQDTQPKNAVIIGGGLIGMEMAENLALKSIKVSVVEFMPQILSFLDREMADMVCRHAQKKGIDFYLFEKVTAIKQKDGRGVVQTDKGRELPADLVIMAVGIKPNIQLAKDAGLRIGSHGGVVTNEYMQSSDPDIYAAGDCVESTNLVTGKPVIFPMGSAANKQGRAAGANAMGRKIAVQGFTGTVIVKVFAQTAAKTGLSEREALAAGFTPFVSYIMAGHHAGYYPGAKNLRIKTIADHSSGRLLGAQVIGREGVDKRIDVMATAIYNHMNQEDLIHLDLAYAPPYSSARDPIIVSGAVSQNFQAGDWQPITPHDLQQKIKAEGDFVLVDVRTKRETEKTGIIPGAIHIPLDDLRKRIIELNSEQEIILYCAVGLRSYVGHRILAMHGFREVKSLTGGFGCWTYETTGESTRHPTPRI